MALDRPGNETILVVEDRRDVAEMARAILDELGYVVIVAGDGPSGLARLAERSDIALLFTDILLPGGMNGVEVAREARRRDGNLKVLLTTATPRPPLSEPMPAGASRRAEQALRQARPRTEDPRGSRWAHGGQLKEQ